MGDRAPRGPIARLGALVRSQRSAPLEDGTNAAQAASTGATPAVGGVRGSPGDWLVGGGVLVVYLTVQVWLLLGPRALDPARYFDTAVHFPHVRADLWTLRIGVVLPVRVAILAFGVSEASLYAVPILAGLAIATAVYVAMLGLFSDRVAAAAAAVVTVLNPDFLLNSSYIYPDNLATATFTAGFAFLVLAAARGAGGIPLVAVVCAGILFGWTYLAREFSPILLLPAVVAAIVFLGHSLRRAALLVAAAALTASLELVYGLLRYDDPFIHVRRLLRRNEIGPPPPRVAHVQSELGNIFDTMAVFPRLLLSWRSGWLFLLVVAVFLVALTMVRDRRVWILGVWVLAFWVIMSVLGLGRLTSGTWVLNVTNVRYWYPILPGLAMGAFGGLWLLVRGRAAAHSAVGLARAACVGLALVVVTPGLVEFHDCLGRKSEWNDAMQRWHELRSWLATDAADRYDTLWTDRETGRLVPAYTATTFGRQVWDGEVESFAADARIPASVDVSRALFLIQKDRFRDLISHPERRLAELRRAWRPVFVSNDGDMVLLAHATSGVAQSDIQPEWWNLDLRFPRVDRGTCGRDPY